MELRELRPIQWVPGAGHEEVRQWYELLRRVGYLRREHLGYAYRKMLGNKARMH